MIRVGMIDSGVAPDVLAAGAHLFSLTPDQPGSDALGHGSVVSALLTTTVAPADLVCAQVFDRRGVTTPAMVAEAVEKLTAMGTEMIVMALGLAQDRAVLRQACEAAVAAGVLVLASAPARGGPCFPAAYPGIVSVSGDARCRPGQTAWFGGAPALFGASVEPAPGYPPGFRGASMAVAHFAAWVWRHFPDRQTRMPAALAAACVYQGRERIGAAGPQFEAG